MGRRNPPRSKWAASQKKKSKWAARGGHCATGSHASARVTLSICNNNSTSPCVYMTSQVKIIIARLRVFLHYESSQVKSTSSDIHSIPSASQVKVVHDSQLPSKVHASLMETGVQYVAVARSELKTTNGRFSSPPAKQRRTYTSHSHPSTRYGRCTQAAGDRRRSSPHHQQL